jgi:hypothetical protein
LPQARAALAAAEASYAAGRTEFGVVLDLLRAVLEDARRIEELRARRRLVLAALEPAVGRELILPPGGAR